MASNSNFIYQQTSNNPSNITHSQEGDGLHSQINRKWSGPPILPNNSVALPSEAADGYRKVVSLNSLPGSGDSLAFLQTACAKVARNPLLADLLTSTSNVNSTQQGSITSEQISEPFSCRIGQPSVALQQASMVPMMQNLLQNNAPPPPYPFTSSRPSGVALAGVQLSAWQQSVNGSSSSQGVVNVQPSSQIQNCNGSPLRRINGQIYIYRNGTWFRFPQQGGVSRPAVQQQLAANNGNVSHLKPVLSFQQQNPRAKHYVYTSQVASSSQHNVAVSKQNSLTRDVTSQHMQSCSEKQNGSPQSYALHQQSSIVSSTNNAQTFRQPYCNIFFVNDPNQNVSLPSDQQNAVQRGMQQQLRPGAQHLTGYHMTEGLQGNVQTNWSTNEPVISGSVARNPATTEPNWNNTNGFFGPNIFPSHMQQPSVPCGVTQQPSVPCGVTQQPSVPCGVTQQPSVPCGVTQQPSVPCGVTQQPSVPCGVTQQPSVPCGVTQQPSVPCGVTQQPSVPCGVTQQPSVPCGVTQQPSVPCGVTQQPSVPCGVTQQPSVPCGVTQQPSVPCGVTQQPSVPCGVTQQPSVPCGVTNSYMELNRNEPCSNLSLKEGAHFTQGVNQSPAYPYSRQSAPVMQMTSNNVNECSVNLNSQNNCLTVSQRVAASEDFLVCQNGMKKSCSTSIQSINFQHPSVQQQCNNLNLVTSLGNPGTIRIESCQSESEPQPNYAFPQATVYEKASTSRVVCEQGQPSHPTILALQNAANDILSRGQMNTFANQLGRSPKNGRLEGEKNYSFPGLNSFASVSFSAPEQQVQQSSSPSGNVLHLSGYVQQSRLLNSLAPTVQRLPIDPNVNLKAAAVLSSKENSKVIKDDLVDSALGRQNFTSEPLSMPVHNVPLQKQNSWPQPHPKSSCVNEPSILNTTSSNQKVLQQPCKSVEVKQEEEDISKLHSCSFSNQNGKDISASQQSNQLTTNQNIFQFPNEFGKGIEEAIMAIFRADPSFFRSQLSKSVELPSTEASKTDSRQIASLVCHQSDHSMLSVSNLPQMPGVLENKARNSIEEPASYATFPTAGIVSHNSGAVNVCRLQKGNQPQIAVVPPIILPSVKHRKLTDNQEGESASGKGKKCSRLIEDIKSISLVVVNAAHQPDSLKSNSDILNGCASVEGMDIKLPFGVDRSLVVSADKNLAKVVKDSSVSASEKSVSVNKVSTAYNDGVIKQELVHHVTHNCDESTSSMSLYSPDEGVELDLSFGISGVCSLAAEDFSSLDDKKLIELSSAYMSNDFQASKNGNALQQSKQEDLHQDELGVKDELCNEENPPLSSDLSAAKPVEALYANFSNGIGASKNGNALLQSKQEDLHQDKLGVKDELCNNEENLPLSSDLCTAKHVEALSAGLPVAKPVEVLSDSIDKASGSLANITCSDSEHLVEPTNLIPLKSQKEEKQSTPHKILNENTEAILTFWNPVDFSELDASNKECGTGQQVFEQSGIHHSEAANSTDERAYPCHLFSPHDEAGTRVFSDASASAIGSQLPELCEEFPFGVANRKTLVTKKTADKSEQTTEYFSSISHTKVSTSGTSLPTLEQVMKLAAPCSNQFEMKNVNNVVSYCTAPISEGTSTNVVSYCTAPISEGTSTTEKLSEMTPSYSTASTTTSCTEEEISAFITDSEIEAVTSSADGLEKINTDTVSPRNHASVECKVSLSVGPKQTAEEMVKSIEQPEVAAANSSLFGSGKISLPGPEQQLEVKALTSGVVSSVLDQTVKESVPSEYQSSFYKGKDTTDSVGMQQSSKEEDVLSCVTITVLDTTKINTFSTTCNVLSNDCKADIKKSLTYDEQKGSNTASTDLWSSSSSEQKYLAKSFKNEALDEDKARQTYCCMYGWLLNVYGNGPGCACETNKNTPELSSLKGCKSLPDQSSITSNSVEITEEKFMFSESLSTPLQTFCKQTDVQNCVKASYSTDQNLNYTSVKESHADKNKKKKKHDKHKVSKHQHTEYEAGQKSHELEGLCGDGCKTSKANAEENVPQQLGSSDAKVNKPLGTEKHSKDLSKRNMPESFSDSRVSKWKCLAETDDATKTKPKIESLSSKSSSLESVKLNVHAFKPHKQSVDHCDEKQRKRTKLDGCEKVTGSLSKVSSVKSCENKCRKEVFTEKSLKSVKAVPTSVKPLKCSNEKDSEYKCKKNISAEKLHLNAHFAVKVESSSVKPFKFSGVKHCEIKWKKEMSTGKKCISVPLAVKAVSASCSKSTDSCPNLPRKPVGESKKVITVQQYLERKKNPKNKVATMASQSKYSNTTETMGVPAKSQHCAVSSAQKVSPGKESAVKRQSEHQSCPSLGEHVSKRCKLSSQPRSDNKPCKAYSDANPKIKLYVHSQTLQVDKHCKVGSQSMTPIATSKTPAMQTKLVSQNLNKENHTKAAVVESKHKSFNQLKSRLWYSSIADKIKKKCKDASGPAKTYHIPKRLPVNKTWSSMNSERRHLKNTVVDAVHSTKEFSLVSQEKAENSKLSSDKNYVIPRMIAFHLWPDTVVLTESTEDVRIPPTKEVHPVGEIKSKKEDWLKGVNSLKNAEKTVNALKNAENTDTQAGQSTLTPCSFQGEALNSTEKEESQVSDEKNSKKVVFQKYRDIYLSRSNSN
ncbi:uncharacterized protein LOC122815541 isoform X2 [Protopterus annectens]|uniref:uncharacterized protein LOC122815541 isoform X2 n=1 Tax=Protopterus annectens TaxID=7888 RepID=UPI001CFC3975|nr:uncharacterized protein LOC122815541 isoform X2 [Protopterus annectens]